VRAQLVTAVRVLAVLTLLLGVVYPVVLTATAQGLAPDRANGALVHDESGGVVGSRLQAQASSSARYFTPRPSATSYGRTGSGGSNLGPHHPRLLADVLERVADFRDRNGLDATTPVPVDAVTASGSGLDPHISIANARLQAPPVAAARDLTLDQVLAAIERHTEDRDLGFIGEVRVHVLELNRDLDAMTTR
jgi:potassium-transporting ATPase KdpC subunit